MPITSLASGSREVDDYNQLVWEVLKRGKMIFYSPEKKFFSIGSSSRFEGNEKN